MRQGLDLRVKRLDGQCRREIIETAVSQGGIHDSMQIIQPCCLYLAAAIFKNRESRKKRKYYIKH